MVARAADSFVFAFVFGEIATFYCAGGHWPPLRPQPQQHHKHQFEGKTKKTPLSLVLRDKGDQSSAVPLLFRHLPALVFALSGESGAAYSSSFGAQLRGDTVKHQPYCLAPTGSSLKAVCLTTRPHHSITDCEITCGSGRSYGRTAGWQTCWWWCRGRDA